MAAQTQTASGVPGRGAEIIRHRVRYIGMGPRTHGRERAEGPVLADDHGQGAWPAIKNLT